jgi:dihydrolipoamide dehydrogenase
MATEIRIPNIGDFVDVPVVELHVKPGDRVAVDTALMVLESDKATVDIPSPLAGTVRQVLVAEGDVVKEGSVVLLLEADEAVEAVTGAATPDISSATASKPEADEHAPLVVIGAGPGGYSAAFRAADLGREVVLIDPRAALGGVCLNVGCIPSKALLHMAKLRLDAAEAAEHGVGLEPGPPDIEKLRAFKDGVVNRLTGGLEGLARRRKVRVIRGEARFTGTHTLVVVSEDGERPLRFDQAIIAAGSEPVRLPFLPDDPRIMDSTGALALADVPARLLVIGGGIIGLEMAQVYHALGSRIDIVEMADQLIPGADKDIVAPLAKRLATQYGSILTGAKVTDVEAGEALTATIEGPEETETRTYDRVLVAVGRVPNGGKVGAEAAGLAVDDRGFIPVDIQMRTAQPHIFAIGDVVGQPMLAHKAVHEGKVAAEVACGENVAFEPAGIPSVAYTDPEIAWVGLTEAQAKAKGIEVRTGKFPWLASGRSLSLGRDEGLTKLVIDPATNKVLGAGIVGPNAGDLIAEVCLAMEMGADAEDIGLTIHPHPTLSETVAFAAEAYSGTLTDL